MPLQLPPRGFFSQSLARLYSAPFCPEKGDSRGVSVFDAAAAHRRLLARQVAEPGLLHYRRCEAAGHPSSLRGRRPPFVAARPQAALRHCEPGGRPSSLRGRRPRQSYRHCEAGGRGSLLQLRTLSLELKSLRSKVVSAQGRRTPPANRRRRRGHFLGAKSDESKSNAATSRRKGCLMRFFHHHHRFFLSLAPLLMKVDDDAVEHADGWHGWRS